MVKYYFLTVLCLFSFVYSYPTNGPDVEKSILITTDDVQSDDPYNESKTDKNLTPIKLRKMKVISNVTNRYAHTLISTYYANPAGIAQEAIFTVVLPDTAFISGFTMEIKGKRYKAYVEEKKKAKQTYDDAVSSGLGAAHVAADARDSNRFTVSMNVEPSDKVIFDLTYEQLLVRKHEKYDMVINLHPGQLVKDLTIDVYINETKPLINVKVPRLRSGNEITESGDTKDNDYAEIDIKNKTTAHVHFAPNIDQQKEMARLLDKSVDKGIAGQFIVEYDVERDPTGGQVLMSSDGYFVHFFSPSELKSIPKHVVFVLDVSGSMHGRKLKQLKEAMQIILDQLSPQDYFNLVEFSDDALVWNLENKKENAIFDTNQWSSHDKPTTDDKLPPAFPAIEKNLKEAKKIVSQMEIKGGTDIYDGLITGARLANTGIKTENPPKPIIIFLTDGQATVGETNLERIMATFAEGNGRYKAALFTLAFGDDADKEFLKKISLKNNGFMRHIYEAADASLQLQDFYKTVSSPLLLNVKFLNSVVDGKSATRNEFDSLYKGGELVVAGKVSETNPDLFKVHGFTRDGPVDFTPEIIMCEPKTVEIGELEKLWAYMTIRQSLDEAAVKDQMDGEEKRRALDLSLKYGFVSPVTSLVVVKPNETKSVETEEAKPRSEFHGGFARMPARVYTSLLGRSSPIMYDRMDDFDSDPVFDELVDWGVDLSETENQPLNETKLSKQTDNDKKPDSFVWIRQYIHTENDVEFLSMNNKEYEIGRNDTVLEMKPCQVLGVTGNCTLLSACPVIYTKLTDLQVFQQYFCTLQSEKYAGVCCVHED